MKKIISHRYFIIVFLLVIADQKFSVLVLRSDLVTGLSDFAYYLSDILLSVGYDVEFSCGFICSYCYDLVGEMAENQ